MTDLLNVADFAAEAERVLPADAFAYLATGACDEVTLRENIEAFGRWQFRPRMLVDVSATSTATTVLGTEVSMPILVAPTAGHRQYHPDGEEATARAAAAAGTVMCLSIAASSTAAQLDAAAPGAPRWLQANVYRHPDFLQRLVDYATKHGFGAIVLTVDTPFVGRRERPLRLGSTSPGGSANRDLALQRDLLGTEAPPDLDATLTWRDLEALVRSSPVPVVVKGILTAEDAELACAAGVSAIIVSNHGGRQLDGSPATLDALPEVVAAAFDGVEVLVDGGVRRGTDVVKALALGARAVLVGRPVCYGLAVDGAAGAERVLELLRAETTLALALLGCPTPEDVTAAHLRPSPRATPLPAEVVER